MMSLRDNQKMANLQARTAVRDYGATGHGERKADQQSEGLSDRRQNENC